MKKVSLLLLGMLLMPFLVNAQKTNLKSSPDVANSQLKRTEIVRGLSFTDFRQSFDTSKVQPCELQLDSAWAFWGKKNWKELEFLINHDHLNKGWPPNNGADSSETDFILEKDMIIDRFGGYIDVGNKTFVDPGYFVGTKDIPFSKRSLSDKGYIYSIYKVLSPIQVKKGQSIPWKGQTGLGIQYRLFRHIDDLKADKCIKELI
jgi:hypothetical protein